MSVEWIAGATAVVVISVLGYIARRIAMSNGERNPLLPVLEQILAGIGDLRTTSEEPDQVDASLLERVEVLERRLEVLARDALRHLQKAAAAEQRMNQRLMGDEEEEEEMTPEEAHRLLANENNRQLNSGVPQQLTIEERQLGTI